MSDWQLPEDLSVAVRIVGSRHWSNELARVLGAVGGTVRVRAVTPLQLLADLLLLRRGTVTLRVGFRQSWRGRAFDVIWCLGVSARCRRTLWIGSDVMFTTRVGVPGRFKARLRDWLLGRSACGAPWFVAELAAVGVEASYVRFPHPTPTPGFRDWPSEFVVSMYATQGNPEFYGASVLPSIASLTPDVTYDVYGGGTVADRPNIVQHGYVPDLSDKLAECVVHLRLTEHDAIAGTVRESLALGRYVIFGYELPGVTAVNVRDVESIVTAVDGFKRSFAAGELPPNRSGMEFAAEMPVRRDAQNLLGWMLSPS